MNATTILKRLKGHGIDDDASVGVVSSYGKGAEIVTKSNTRDLIVTANTGDIDLDNEVVEPKGADTTYFERNGIIFADHKYDLEQVVGKMRRLDKYPSEADHKSWRVRMNVADNPIGNAVWTIVKETGQIGVSIGFKALDFGPLTDDEREKYKSKSGVIPRSIVRAWEWFELSCTALPCNVACQSMAFSEGKSLDQLNAVDELVTKGLIDRKSASLLGMPITPERKFHAITDKKSTQLIFGEDGMVLVKSA